METRGDQPADLTAREETTKWLQEQGRTALAEATQLIRRYPAQSFLAALAAGYALSKLHQKWREAR